MISLGLILVVSMVYWYGRVHSLRLFTGIGSSTPTLAIFDSATEVAEFFSRYPTNVNESISSFGRVYAQSQYVAQLAKARIPELAASVTTAAVTSDMFQIVHAFGQDKLNYWGIS